LSRPGVAEFILRPLQTQVITRDARRGSPAHHIYMNNQSNIEKKTKGPKGFPAASYLHENEIVEMVYDPEKKRTDFVVWKDNNWSFQKEYQAPGQTLIPYSPFNNLITNGVVLLPSGPEEYHSESALLSDIQAFIHKYVDVTPLFEKIASYYILFSWVYDSFNELPYLRLRGEPGSGKTRFLLIVGSLCYKPIFASGASTTSPLFRILDAFRGTLIIDESDFRMSDERAEMVKILNNGNVKGFPVLRCEVSPTTKEFNPRAYAVFGPKIVATRGAFEDRALESRFLTEEMGQHKLREDIPINLKDFYQSESLALRNKLLLFRFRNLHKQLTNPELVDRRIEPRLNQIFIPLLSIVEDKETINDLAELARNYNSQMINERGTDTEAQILEIIRDFYDSPEVNVPVKDITSHFIERHSEDYERKITPKWIGHLLRTKLRLFTQKSSGSFVIPSSEYSKIQRLYERYGIHSESPGYTPVQSPASPQVPPLPLNSPILDLSKSPQSPPDI